MRNLFLMLATFCCTMVFGQDFSNKGTDFWVGYGSHVSMYNSNGTAVASGGGQDMVLYFATDLATTVTVSIPSVGYLITYNIPANSIYTSNPLPKSGAQDVRLLTEGITSKGIHITANNPVVAYAHIYASSVSGATLLFPTNTLGKQYYSINYDQNSNNNYSYCFFYAVATDTGTTTIQVTPSGNTQNMTAGQAYTYTLQQGQIFNALGSINGTSGVDLTGSKIQSISAVGAGCKRIAVFSGSGKIYINCANSQASSADNYMVQSFPSNAWGKHFLTAPTLTLPYNFFRICVSDASAVVKVDGVVQSNLVNGFYYSVLKSNTPHYIEGDKPITIAQYITTQAACGNGSPGDPEVIYLSPIEQNISKVILNSTPNYKITEHHINVIIPTTGTASFLLDGAPTASFVPHPQLAGYSYAQFTVAAGAHTISSDSGFNAIAYGYGSAESYGYNAGANVIDLTQGLQIQNQYTNLKSLSTCVGTPFTFQVRFPYQPLSITWDFGNNPNLSPNTIVGPIANPVADSSFIDANSGKMIYLYKLAGTYIFNTIGTDSITVTSNNPTSDGCSGEQKQTYPVNVFGAPVANFAINSSGCLSDSVYFKDSSNALGRTFVKWSWNLGDNTVDSIQNPTKKYNAPGNYNVKLAVINDIGCYADTTKPVMITSPVAKFGVSDTTCINGSIVFRDSSTISSGSIVGWYWDYGDAAKDTLTVSANRTHVYSKLGTYTVSLTIVSSTGCQVTTTKTITINPRPVVGFILPEVCLKDKFITFTDTSYISDGSPLKYIWNFTGTPTPSPTTAFVKTPQIQFFAAGNYFITDTIISNFGCKAVLTQPFTVNGSVPKAAFAVQNTTSLCSNDSVFVKNFSNVDFGSVTKTELYWDFGNNPAQKIVDDTPIVNRVFSHLYPNFQSPLTQNITIRLIAYSGISCLDIKDTVIVLNASPKVQFASMPGICLDASPLQITQAIETGGVPGAFIYGGTGASATGLFTPTIPGVGVDTISVVYVSTQGCKDSAKQTKTVWPRPTAAFTFSSPNCVTQAIGFTDGSVANFGNVKQWKWSFGDTQSQTNASAVTFTHTYTNIGIDTVVLQVITDSGCTSLPIQMVVNIHPLPVPDFSVPAICLPLGAAQFFDSSKISDNSQIQFSYLWNFGDISSGGLNSSTLMNPVHNYSGNGPFNVMLIVTSKDGCPASKMKALTEVYPQPIADFNAVPTYVCIGDTINFFDKSDSLNQHFTNWYWDFGDNSRIVTTQNTSHLYTRTGTFNVSLYTNSNKGCLSNTAVNPVTVYPYPVISAGPDLAVLPGGQVQIKATATGASGYQYTWTPTTYLSNPAILQPIVIDPLSDMTYTLTVTAAGGCSVPSDDVFVKLLLAPVIPNAFSPNNDGINDVWTIKNLDSYPGVTVQIFDRYGRLILDKVGYATPWDGKVNGTDLPIGTYYYVIDPKNGRSPMTGSVTILR